jgi:hypothetical protein
MTQLVDAPLIPVSWGELIDKITILEIKAVRIPDAEARARVSTELALLLQVAGSVFETTPQIAELKDALRSTNDRLWDVEDRIRLKERYQAFDAEFVELARSVYRLNDQRFMQKREVDRCLSSTVREQKYFSSTGPA